MGAYLDLIFCRVIKTKWAGEVALYACMSGWGVGKGSWKHNVCYSIHCQSTWRHHDPFLMKYTTAGHIIERETGHSNWPGVILQEEGCSIIGWLFLPIQIWQKWPSSLVALSSLHQLKTYSAKQALKCHKTESEVWYIFFTFQPCFAFI